MVRIGRGFQRQGCQVAAMKAQVAELKQALEANKKTNPFFC